MKDKAVNALLEMGAPANLKGFNYIVDAMILFEDDKWLKSKMMNLYAQIASMNNSTASKVERAIRSTFKKVLDSGDLEIIEKYLTHKNASNGNLLHVFYLKLKLSQEE